MQFIEALKLRSKLFFLFLLITIGLISTGIMGAMNINVMKKNLDSLYFGSLIPVSELNEILQTYHSDLQSAFLRAKYGEISPDLASFEVEKSLVKIKKLWKSYEGHYKREEELQYIEYLSLELNNTNNFFLKMLQVAKGKEDMSKISVLSLEKQISHIDKIIQKLIKYEIEVAQFERKTFLEKYDYVLIKVGMMLLLIIIAILLISYHVFRSIQKDHTKLEITTNKLIRTNKKLENVSYIDALTSLNNRRYFNLVYERELKRAKRTHAYITFMMIDIDFFKQYNDTYGHIKGDEALKTVAQILKEILQRPSDFVFRLGGEEFGILLTDTDEANSVKLAHTLCEAVKARKIEHHNSKVNSFLTISIGLVCCIADDALNDDILISSADKMLYRAKEEGRDRCVSSADISEARAQALEEELSA